MPNLWDKTPDMPLQAELNPLTNPALERNLGRWAQVYFSNPPGKREQAVSKLVEEIKRETSGELADEIICSACQHKNSPHYKFCGRCGGALKPVLSSSNTSPHFTTIRVPVEAAHQFPQPAPFSSESRDAQWLREKTLGSLDASDARDWGGWKYLVGGMVIALACFGYLQWSAKAKLVPKPELETRSQTTTPTPTTPIRLAPKVAPADAPGQPPRAAPAKSVPVENSVPAQVPSPPETAAPDSRTLQVQRASASIDQRDQRSAAADLRGSAPSPRLDAAVSPRTVGGEGGLPELQLAQRYLGGSMGVRDSSEAAKLLWKAVRKENTRAALLLSGLYVRGDGVPKSCDQARLLLVAATKRGSAQAAQQLRDLQSHGCR